MYKKNSSAPLALQMLITSVYLCLIENHVNIGQINALFLHCSFIFFFFSLASYCKLAMIVFLMQEF